MAAPIPTNIITGFLGVGKTTAIQALLAEKPTGQRWAVLVNEFGEVGIDGSLLARREGEQAGVYIREVPGGCMCCTAGLPMQIALNMLLARAKPHRLLIEPTGLGHPREVMATLAAPHYRELLSLRSTVTLVDARQVQRGDCVDHPSFREQLAIADVILASKADLYAREDFTTLLNFLDTEGMLGSRALYPVQSGKLQLDWLEPATRQDLTGLPLPAAPDSNAAEAAEPELPEQGYLCKTNQGDGFYSRGWVFDRRWIFDAVKLHSLLSDIDTDRAKGVFITEDGVAGFNKSDGVLTQVPLDDCLDSRLECIGRDERAFDDLESALLACAVSH